MSKHGYIDAGDRVVVTGIGDFSGSDNLSDHQGKHGEVLNNDGWGLCTVKLDDGTVIRAWNGGDLDCETITK